MKEWTIFVVLFVMAAIVKAGAVILAWVVELIDWAEPGVTDARDIAMELWGMRWKACTAIIATVALIK